MAESVGINENSLLLSPAELVKRFNALQEERVLAYKLFEEGFQAYLAGSPNYNFPLYRQLVHEMTQTFNNISQDIISIREKLCNEHSLNVIASLIDKVQDQEKKKLETTAKLQMCRQNIADHPDDESYKIEETQSKDSIQETITKINEYLEELKYESEELFTISDNEDGDADTER